MITGYNTDVRHGDKVFHVQTEDKGLPNAWIESLIYIGGQIVARKRLSYKAQLDQGKGMKEIAELMDRQHRLMIAGIRQGHFDEQLAAAAAPPPVVAAAGVPAAFAEMPAPAHTIAAPPVGPDVPDVEVPDVDVPTLDQVILEYLNSEAEQEHLVLMMDAEEDLTGGRRAALSLRAKSSVSGEPVPQTRVTVRLISTVAEPTTLGRGQTDDRGELNLAVNIPTLDTGTGALIVTAESDLGTAEIKQLL